MIRALLLASLLFIPVPLFCQSTSGTTVPCSIANTGSKDIFTINCGLGKEAAEKMRDILNHILVNQLDPNAVMGKLDEIPRIIPLPVKPVETPKSVVAEKAEKVEKVQKVEKAEKQEAPTTPVITYLFNGDERITTQGQTKINSKNPAARAYAKFRVADAMSDWKTLAVLCDSAIKETPEWLTPLLFKGLAYSSLGKKEEAISILEEAKRKAEGNADYEGLIPEADKLLKEMHAPGY